VYHRTMVAPNVTRDLALGKKEKKKNLSLPITTEFWDSGVWTITYVFLVCVKKRHIRNQSKQIRNKMSILPSSSQDLKLGDEIASLREKLTVL